MIPYHFYNFTKYWIIESCKRNNLEIVELIPVGGRWASNASHFIYFFLQAFGYGKMSSKEFKRNIFFYLLFPFMAVYSIISIPICLFFSLGDLHEEPLNHLVVIRKKR